MDENAGSNPAGSSTLIDKRTASVVLDPYVPLRNVGSD